jgi:hypothetical protein
VTKPERRCLKMSSALKKILTNKASRNETTAVKIIKAEAKAGHPWCC